MRMFNFIISVFTFLVSLFYMIFYFPDFTTVNGIIYFMMLFILQLICITGVIINRPAFTKFHYHKKLKGSNKYNIHI